MPSSWGHTPPVAGKLIAAGATLTCRMAKIWRPLYKKATFFVRQQLVVVYSSSIPPRSFISRLSTTIKKPRFGCSTKKNGLKLNNISFKQLTNV